MTNEELVEKLRFCAAGKCTERECGAENCWDNLMYEAADAIEELEFACNRYEKDYKALCAYLPKWIHVTDRLPDDDTHVLGWDGERVRFVYVVTDLVFDAFAEKEGITHWQPLPEPPNEE